jgi:hypothetical protein
VTYDEKSRHPPLATRHLRQVETPDFHKRLEAKFCLSPLDFSLEFWGGTLQIGDNLNFMFV